MAVSISSVSTPDRRKTADGFHAIARHVLWIVAVAVMVVVPWFFGGGGPEGYYAIVWGGRLCLIPLGLWGLASWLRRDRPGAEFWVPVICWALLAVQVIVSIGNPSHVPQAPWEGTGSDRIPHNEILPSSAFSGGTLAEGHLWLAFGLIALTAHRVGLTPRQLRVLLWLFVTNATVLAVIGIPYKYSGVKAILGKWEVPEWYFYSTFLYHNHWCAFALLAVAATVGLCVTATQRAVRAILIIMGVALVASAPLSTSRLGTLAMLAFGIFVIGVLLRSRFSSGRKSSRTIIILLTAAVFGAIVVGGGVLYLYKIRGGPGGHRTWQGILRSNPFGLRQTFIEDTIPMLKTKPWFGWGLGGYGAAFRFYQRPETIIVHNEGRVTYFDHIHNDWVERLAELGFVGFSLFLAPGILWLRRARQGPPLPAVERWLFAGCVGLLIFAFGDMAFLNPTVAASFAILFSLAVSRGERFRQESVNP
jgi:O-antigen ligase